MINETNITAVFSILRHKEFAASATVFTILLGMFLVLIGILGLFGTVLLIVTIVRFKYSKTEAPFIVILSLCVSDAGHLLVVVSHVGPELLAASISLGNLMETVVTHSNLLFWYSSLGNYFLMALNRYLAVCKPHVHLFTVKRTSLLCLLAWGVSLIFALSPLSGICCRKVFDIHYDELQKEGSESENILKISTQVLSGITIGFMSFCYIAVFIKLKSNASKVHAASRTAYQRKHQAHHQRRMKKVCLQFLIISFLFGVLLIVQFVTQLGFDGRVVISILQLVYTVNSAINPSIYASFNIVLRSQMLGTMMCKSYGRISQRVDAVVAKKSTTKGLGFHTLTHPNSRGARLPRLTPRNGTKGLASYSLKTVTIF